MAYCVSCDTEFQGKCLHGPPWTSCFWCNFDLPRVRCPVWCQTLVPGGERPSQRARWFRSLPDAQGSTWAMGPGPRFKHKIVLLPSQSFVDRTLVRIASQIHAQAPQRLEAWMQTWAQSLPYPSRNVILPPLPAHHVVLDLEPPPEIKVHLLKPRDLGTESAPVKFVLDPKTLSFAEPVQLKLEPLDDD